MRAHVTVGQHFVFCEDGITAKKRGRLARLLGYKEDASAKNVVPLLDDPVELPGFIVKPPYRGHLPLGCLVADRDLYRAGEDAIHLYAAALEQGEGWTIEVRVDGALLLTRKLDAEDAPGFAVHGTHVETLSSMTPGNYEAQLKHKGASVGVPTRFVVAAYQLAPLTGRLKRHSLDRSAGLLEFALEVESFQQPFDGALEIELLDEGVCVAQIVVEPSAPGQFEGAFNLAGDGPFRLRLIGREDQQRTCEVVIPGTRKAERDLTVVSELGAEMSFSLMPEPGALPVRAGFLTEGDFLPTPITIEDLVTHEGELLVREDVEALTLACYDATAGRFLDVIKAGDVKKGEKVKVPAPSAACLVFIGCFVRGKPFEAYTTLFAPSSIDMELAVAEQCRPGQAIEVALRAGGKRPLPVLISIRDERLTQTDRPAVALTANLKRLLDRRVDGLGDADFHALSKQDTWYQLLGPRYGVRPAMGAGRTRSAFSGGFSRFGADGEILPPPPWAPDAPSRGQAALPGLGAGGMMFDALEDEDDVDGEATGEIALGSAAAIPDGLGRVPAAPPVHVRQDFPESLFFNVVHVEGEARIEIPVGDAIGSYVVEVFALLGGDWWEEKAVVRVDQPVKTELLLPSAMFDGDKVTGRLVLTSLSGEAEVTLTCDGQPVALRDTTGKAITDLARVRAPADLRFDVKPGLWRADAVADGESDHVEQRVGEPTAHAMLCRTLQLLKPGESITLDDVEDALSLRVLPGVDGPMKTLFSATQSYAYACCEQTAAKMCAAAAALMTSNHPQERAKAEDTILMGIAREEQMFLPGRGFSMYPGNGHPSDYWSPLCVSHLWQLAPLQSVPEVSAALKTAVGRALEMADDAGRAHRLERHPQVLRTVVDAYRVAVGVPSRRTEVLAYLERLMADRPSAAQLPYGTLAYAAAAYPAQLPYGQVQERQTLAYAAAAYLTMGDIDRGIELANVVCKALNDQGRLYSTVDSAAAVALFLELAAKKVGGGDGSLKVNGKSMRSDAAVKLGDQVETVSCSDGVAVVEVTRIKRERWDDFRADTKVRIGLRDHADRSARRFKKGDRATLRIELQEAYEEGDLVHVCLPPCMSRLLAGGQVQRFTADFEGEQFLEVPVLVTTEIEGEQHWAVALRNMFKEERGASSGLLKVTG